MKVYRIFYVLVAILLLILLPIVLITNLDYQLPAFSEIFSIIGIIFYIIPTITILGFIIIYFLYGFGKLKVNEHSNYSLIFTGMAILLGLILYALRREEGTGIFFAFLFPPSIILAIIFLIISVFSKEK